MRTRHQGLVGDRNEDDLVSVLEDDEVKDECEDDDNCDDDVSRR